MEFYTLNPQTFEREALVDEFESVIWTERFIAAGDIKLVLEATHERLQLLAPGTLLSLNESREIMVLDTREVNNGAITVSGKTLEAFFQYRYTDRASYKHVTARFLLYALVTGAQTRSGSFYYSNIPGLRVEFPTEDPDTRKVLKRVKRGPVYPVMLEVANKYKIDMSIKRTTDDGEHKLLFVTRYGEDRSRTQPAGTFNNLVRFSPELDNLANIKELRSDVDYINFVFVWPPTAKKFPAAPNGFPGNKQYTNPNDGYLPNDMPGNPFARRFAEVYMDDEVSAEDIAEQVNEFPDGPLWPDGYVDIVEEMMEDEAEKIFAAHKRTKVVDGEVIPGTQYIYKRDYDLGDFVDIEGTFGNPIKGRVTEYIRSQDASGETGYPTISANPYANPAPA